MNRFWFYLIGLLILAAMAAGVFSLLFLFGKYPLVVIFALGVALGYAFYEPLALLGEGAWIVCKALFSRSEAKP